MLVSLSLSQMKTLSAPSRHHKDCWHRQRKMNLRQRLRSFLYISSSFEPRWECWQTSLTQIVRLAENLYTGLLLRCYILSRLPFVCKTFYIIIHVNHMSRCKSFVSV